MDDNDFAVKKNYKSSATKPKTVKIEDYYKKDDTYVKSHIRSNKLESEINRN
jgi:hypothetical protein